jgi:hypothetical protein
MLGASSLVLVLGSSVAEIESLGFSVTSAILNQQHLLDSWSHYLYPPDTGQSHTQTLIGQQEATVANGSSGLA